MKTQVKYIPKHLEIDKVRNMFVVDGIDYPPTRHNSDVIKAYLERGEEHVLKSLSTVILSFD